MAHSAAFRSLSGNALKVLIELRCKFNGANNGKIPFSYAQAASTLHIGMTTIGRALQELQVKGFVRRTREGHWYGRQAALWAVTDKGIDGVPATRDWTQWTAPEKQKSLPIRNRQTSRRSRFRSEELATVPFQEPSEHISPERPSRSGSTSITISTPSPAPADQSPERSSPAKLAPRQSADSPDLTLPHFLRREPERPDETEQPASQTATASPALLERYGKKSWRNVF